MPYCDPCAKHWTPTSVNPDGTCPRCGGAIAPPRPIVTLGDRPDADGGHPGDERPKAPWHFKLLLGALTLYLGFRAFQGVEWLATHL